MVVMLICVLEVEEQKTEQLAMCFGWLLEKNTCSTFSQQIGGDINRSFYYITLNKKQNIVIERLTQFKQKPYS